MVIINDQDCFLIRTILRKLDNLNIYGGKHKSIVRVYRAVPSHLRGRAKELLDYLCKKEIIVAKQTVEDLHIHLNETRSKTIKQICLTESAGEIRNLLEQ